MPKRTYHEIDHATIDHFVHEEVLKFHDYYDWLCRAMPSHFFEEVQPEYVLLIAHALVSFDLHDHFNPISLHKCAIVLSTIESTSDDTKTIHQFEDKAIFSIQLYTSSEHLIGTKNSLRIAIISYGTPQNYKPHDPAFLRKVQKACTASKNEAVYELMVPLVQAFDESFIRSLAFNDFIIALQHAYNAQQDDYAHVSVYPKNKESTIVTCVYACKGVPYKGFLIPFLSTISGQSLKVYEMTSTIINPFTKDQTFVCVLTLRSVLDEKWEKEKCDHLKRSLEKVASFSIHDALYHTFVPERILPEDALYLIRAIATFLHQLLVHQDSNVYTLESIQEAFDRYPEIAQECFELFTLKFNPIQHNLDSYEKKKLKLLTLIDKHEFGRGEVDSKRKTVFRMTLAFIDKLLKTNYYARECGAFSFRLDPLIVKDLPTVAQQKFTVIPYAIFFIYHKEFFGFHIRFQDLARGGLRTVFFPHRDVAQAEAVSIFHECYHLALTQQKKNKDIPEGGAKGILFIHPQENQQFEEKIFLQNIKASGIQDTQQELEKYKKMERNETLYRAQRHFVRSLMALINTNHTGKFVDENIVDYWNKPTYLYLGPDENMQDCMIEWIANYARQVGYKPGVAFISSKPLIGINHKHYGVTSLGINECMKETLYSIGIDPYKDHFTVKMSGGPDGDVAGNQICNLANSFAKTCKLLTLVDVSGVIYDPQGLDFSCLKDLFVKGLSIKHYPPKLLADGGFLLDKEVRKTKSLHHVETLCYRKQGKNIEEVWLSADETQEILTKHVHRVQADVFIPGGGRPRALNEDNMYDFLDAQGKPTAKVIIEGANLYLTQEARLFLEERGTLIIKDSSANKGGVICSSFEVLCGLVLSESEFLENKEEIVKEILEEIKDKAREEVRLILKTHAETQIPCSEISVAISEKIKGFSNQIRNYLERVTLSKDPKDPYNSCIYEYVLPILSQKYGERLLAEIPDVHQKAIIACYIAAKIVYLRGLQWNPTIIEMLPFFCKNPAIRACPIQVQ